MRAPWGLVLGLGRVARIGADIDGMTWLRYMKSNWKPLLLKNRGVPWREAAAAHKDGALDAELFLSARNSSMTAAALDSLVDAWDEAARRGWVLTLPSEAHGTWPASLSVRGSFFITTQMKLEHDAEQLRHLVGKGKLPQGFLRLAAAYEAESGAGETTHWTMQLLRPEAYLRLGGTHNTLLYVPPDEALRGPALSRQFLELARDVEDAYFDSAARGLAPATIVDGLLSDEALDALTEYCTDATIWFDLKPGYVGAHFDDGLFPEVLLEIASSLQRSLPRLLGGMQLRAAWAFKYREERIDAFIHSDPFDVSVNLWLTPDDANQGGFGGLILHRAATGDVDSINPDVLRETRDRIATLGEPPTVVPYKRNRAIIFQSNITHETDVFRFKPGYTNRRINLSILFSSLAAEGILPDPQPIDDAARQDL